MFKRILCRLLRHKLVLDMRQYPYGQAFRLRCTSCGACDPYQHNPQ